MAVIRFTGLLSPVAQLAQVCLMKNHFFPFLNQSV